MGDMMPTLPTYTTEIEQIHAHLGSKRRPGQTIAPVKFIVAHDTGNPGASARGHANWYRSDPNPAWVSSAHLFVDDTRIVETIPAFTSPERAYHVLYSVPTDNMMFGADANTSAIGVEYCYGGNIDPAAAYDRYVWTLAQLCLVHSLDPANRIVGHQVLDPARKIDPGNGLAASGLGYSYDKLLADVVTRFADVTDNSIAPGSDAIVKDKLARATVHLNLREKATSKSKKMGQIKPGETIAIKEIIEDGETVMGITKWCKIAENNFCWSGGLVRHP